MLNNEGWSLLFILTGVLLLLAAGFTHMGRERTMEDRLRADGGAADTAAGLALRAAGVTVLAVLPGTIYLYGLARMGMVLSLAAGYAVLLCVLLPRLRGIGGEARTAAEIYSKHRAARAGFAGVSALSLLLLAAGGISMLARVFAGVFSLHYTIALAAAVLLCTLLAVLCGAAARRRMDRVQIFLVLFGLLAVPMTAVLLHHAEENSLMVVLRSAFSRANSGNVLGVDIASDMLWGVGAMGLAAMTHRGWMTREEHSLRFGGRIGTLLIFLMLLLAAALGLMGRMVDGDLSGVVAAETIYLQMAENAALSAPLSGLMVTTLVTAFVMSVQDALATAGNLLAWDVVQPLCSETRERPLRAAADLLAVGLGLVGFLLALNANVRLLSYARSAFLLSSVLAVCLLLRIFVKNYSARGAWWGLIAGTMAAAVWLCVPFTRELGMIGVIPCAAVTAALYCTVDAKP